MCDKNRLMKLLVEKKINQGKTLRLKRRWYIDNWLVYTPGNIFKLKNNIEDIIKTGYMEVQLFNRGTNAFHNHIEKFSIYENNRNGDCVISFQEFWGG